jgi:hypothetical protein
MEDVERARVCLSAAPDLVGIYTDKRAFLELFEEYCAPRLNHRAETFRTVFKLLNGHPARIFETGCLRVPGNWEGDGQSTFMFDRYVESYGGKLMSIDISPEAVKAAQEVTWNAEVNCGDSVAFLNAHCHRYSDPIQLLYLDSWDLDANNPLIAAHHHMNELCAAMPALDFGSIVFVDDTWRHANGKPFGKGMLIADFMDKIGAEQIAEGENQFAWRM